MAQDENVAYERIALATAIWTPEGFRAVMESAKAGFFSTTAHQIIYGVLASKHASGEDGITTSIVARELEASGDLAAVGGPRWLTELTNENVPVARIPGIINDLRTTWAARSAKNVLAEAAEIMNYAGGDPSMFQAAMGEHVKKMDELIIESVPPSYDTLESVLRTTHKDITEPDAVELYPTGFRDMDELMGGGMRGGQLVLIAARPATGKSVMALNILSHLAIKRGVPCAYFSREMLGPELAKRLLAAESKITLDALNSRKLKDNELERLNQTIQRIAGAKLFVDDSTDTDIADIVAKAKQLQRREGVKVIAIDYIQLVNCIAITKRGGGRQEEMAEVSKLTKRLALATGLVVIAVAQLNRGPEQRGDKRPALADLRESGQLEQDADTAILLHREDMYSTESERAGEVDFIVAKHRNGPTKTVAAAFQGHFSRMVDMAYEQAPAA